MRSSQASSRQLLLQACDSWLTAFTLFAEEHNTQRATGLLGGRKRLKGDTGDLGTSFIFRF